MERTSESDLNPSIQPNVIRELDFRRSRGLLELRPHRRPRPWILGGAASFELSAASRRSRFANS